MGVVMADPDQKIDDKKGDEVLRRMLKTPPEPNVNPRERNPGYKRKPGGHPAKNDRPEERD
jgi:hypothetical protein